ncbi:MAG: ornithine carbamoyltransferase [Anaerolineae bacterium]|nr:ornithine carbamoyltransferase [Anaerolineae bacterium]
MKHLICLADLSLDEIWHILNTARDLKAEWQAGGNKPILAGKALAMIFEKPSLRTRVSFEMAMVHLGGHAIYLSPQEIGLGKRESVPDVARVLSGMVQGIEARVFAHRNVELLAQYATVPVINGLSDFSHPCQALGDVLTLWEKRGEVKGQKLVFVGDGNNVANSLLFIGGKLGMHVTVATPAGYEPHPAAVRLALEAARKSGAQIEVLNDPIMAVQGADVVYTDVWASMGQESEAETRKKDFAAFQVNGALMAHARDDALFMHCLPAHRGEEVTDEVTDSPNSVIFDEAENRLHAQKAVLALLMG